MADQNAGNNPTAGAGSTQPDNKGVSQGQTAGSNAGNQTVPLPELLKERESRQALQAEVEALKAAVANMAGNANRPDPVNNFQSAPRVNPREELDALWREDPRKAMQAELVMAINWRDQVESQVDSQIEGASRRYSDFNNFQTEIRRYLKGIPIDQRNKPGIVDAAYFMVKGQKTEDLIKSEVDARLKKMTSAEFSSMSGGGSSGGGTQNVTVLNDEQRGAARAMGVTDAEYLKYLK